MTEELSSSNFIIISITIGFGATLIMDLYALFQKRFFGITSLNYALVGRWILHMPKGILLHKNILLTEPITMESTVGWLAHYATGIIFTAIMILLNGNTWLIDPTITPSIIFGLSTVIFPYMIMQPSFGFGFAAAKMPQPNVARIRSLIAHAIFGLGLYLSASIRTLII
ncbi:DUF2938 domain-containing protein [Enterovibrio makurazakiensis]|uniref:DUF2938 domain-containing protein n=1 Tax=Enterovibrio makurazakiensis TaxID=2910232 RepID=UPI003D247FD1